MLMMGSQGISLLFENNLGGFCFLFRPFKVGLLHLVFDSTVVNDDFVSTN